MGDRLQGKVAVITGASSGIGAASARRFVEEGCKVVVADVQTDLGRQVADDLGDEARFIECDVTDESGIVAAIELATGTWGRLDVMFNNAGVVGAIGPVADTEAGGVGANDRHPADVGVLRLQARRPRDGAAGLGFDHQHLERRRDPGWPRPPRVHRVQGGRDRAHEVGGRGTRATGCSLQHDRPGRHTDGAHRPRHVRRCQRPRSRGRVVEAAIRTRQ